MKRSVLCLRIGLAVAMLLALTITVYAAATFGGATGPAFLNPGYRFTAQVTALSNPHNNVCLLPTVNGVAQTAIACNCSAPDCNPSTGIGQWSCTIPANYSNAVVHWDISAYAGGSCSGNKAQGPTGTFTTSLTALTIMTLDSSGASPEAAPLIALLLTAAMAGVGWWGLRRRSAA